MGLVRLQFVLESIQNKTREMADRALEKGLFDQAAYNGVVAKRGWEIEAGIMVGGYQIDNIYCPGLILNPYPTEPYLDESDGDVRFDRYMKEIRNGTWRSSYVLSDNVEQIKEYWKNYLSDSDRMFLIEINVIFKETNPGFRWHKNGPYIGTFNHQCEYLGDEEGIELVLSSHLYELNQEVYNQLRGGRELDSNPQWINLDQLIADEQKEE